MKGKFPTYKTVSIDTLIPYARNSRTHSDAQITKIAASIKEFGFLNPVIIDGDNGIVAGHGRVLAAKKLGMAELPVIEANHLTDAQRRAYVIADNRLALDAGWDDQMLLIEFTELQDAGFDILLTGFTEDEFKDIGLFGGNESPEDENPYSQKVSSPTYVPNGDKPLLQDLYNDEKAMGLIEDIKNSNLPNDEKQFLMAAASRHIVFDYGMIANYYAHSDADCQRLMEDSALVIVDFEKAIEMGYVKLNETLASIYLEEQEGMINE
jgi:hypothetical protein